jgi:hypothetical protein
MRELSSPPIKVLVGLMALMIMSQRVILRTILFIAFCYVLFSYLLSTSADTGPPRLSKWIRNRAQKKPPPPKANVLICRQCGIPSCCDCNSLFHPFAPCVRSKDGTLEGLRVYVEEQITAKLVRICPKCKTQFNKTDGCNKIKVSSCSFSFNWSNSY